MYSIILLTLSFNFSANSLFLIFFWDKSFQFFINEPNFLQCNLYCAIWGVYKYQLLFNQCCGSNPICSISHTGNTFPVMHLYRYNETKIMNTNLRPSPSIFINIFICSSRKINSFKWTCFFLCWNKNLLNKNITWFFYNNYISRGNLFNFIKRYIKNCLNYWPFRSNNNNLFMRRN